MLGHCSSQPSGFREALCWRILVLWDLCISALMTVIGVALELSSRGHPCSLRLFFSDRVSLHCSC